MLGSAARGKVRLISRETIFEQFHDHDSLTSQTDKRTDEQTDGQLVGAYAWGPAFCWAHCQHAQNRDALHDLPASQSDSTSWKLTLTLTLSTPWMQAYLGTIVCKFGGDPVICLWEGANYTADRHATDTTYQTRLTTSQTHSTQPKAGNLPWQYRALRSIAKLTPGVQNGNIPKLLKIERKYILYGLMFLLVLWLHEMFRCTSRLATR